MRLPSPRRSPAACLAALFALSLLSGSVRADVVYREVFPNQFTTPPTTPAREAVIQGWWGNQHGVIPFGTSTAQIFNNVVGSPNEPTPVNSNPVGPLTPNTGTLFWSPAARAGIYLYTNEIAPLGLTTNELRNVSWDSRNNTDPNSASTAMRLALLVNGSWYVSDTGDIHTAGPSTWQSNSLDVTTLTFGLFADHNLGESPLSLPRNNVGSHGLALPFGSVQAIGLYMDFNTPFPGQGQAQYRIDNFAVTAQLPPPPQAPEPSSVALFALGGAALAGWRRWRNRSLASR